MKNKKILIVDDEVNIRRYVSGLLRKEGYEPITASDGQEAILLVESENPILVILDIMMPQMDGFEVCKRLRKWSIVPIIMLSAKCDESDKVQCFDMGVDDYVTKPFGANELISRVRAVLRRIAAISEVRALPYFVSGDLEINFAQRQVSIAGKEIKLTRTEFNLLQELTLNAGKVLTHIHLLQKVWGPEYRNETEYLHGFIWRLRNKLEPDKEKPPYIISVAGIGYRFQTGDKTE